MWPGKEKTKYLFIMKTCKIMNGMEAVNSTRITGNYNFIK